MKLKGINIIERHVEKVFFLLVTLVFGAVVVWQFALGGNAVDVGGQQDVPVDKAYDQIARIAEQKLAQMQQGEADNRVPTAAPDAVTEIRTALTYQGPDASLPIPLGPRIAGLGGAGSTDVPVDRLIAVAPVETPRPDTARAGEHAAALDPLVVAATPEIETFVAAQQPYDLRAVSIAARFDSAALLDALRRDPDGERGPMRAIPEPWWRGRIEILDVQIERREVMADGARSGGALVSPTPGRFTLRDRVADSLAVDDMPAIVADARQFAKDIVQPPFWGIIAGEPWAPPAAEAQDGDNEAAEIARLLRQLESIRAEIARAQDALGGGARSAIDIFDPAAGVLAQGGVSGGGGGGGRGGGSAGPSPEQLEQERRQRQRAAIEARLADLRERESTLVDQLTGLGVDPDSGRATAAGEALPDLPSRIADADELTVWGHDLEVEGGRTYEYRLRVLVNNPLFGFANNLAEESRAAAEEPVLASEWSAWTSPVSVDRDLYWFATRASEGGRQAVGVVAPTTTVEVYRFYYGFWRRDEARIRIGDPIAASINIAERELPIFRIERPESGGPAFVAGQELISQSLLTSTGSLLLDVRPAAVQTGRERPLGVVVREPGGELATRRPADDLVSDLRRRLEQSAGAGLYATIGVPGEGLAEAGPTPNRAAGADRNEGAAPAGGERGIQR
ncbi:MAG: hypothetical protein ACF8QF_01185 [Phycisphaerales bacterium]